MRHCCDSHILELKVYPTMQELAQKASLPRRHLCPRLGPCSLASSDIMPRQEGGSPQPFDPALRQKLVVL